MWRPAALRGAAGIEDLEAIPLLVQGQMGMSEDNRVRIGESRSEPLQAALGGTGVMDHAEDDLFQLERERLGEVAAELGAVDVAMNGGDGPYFAQLGQHRGVAEVAGVDDQVGGVQGVQATIGKTPITAREVGVGDQRETDQSSRRSERARLASMRSR